MAPLRYICFVCGEIQEIGVNVPSAPSFEQMELKCEKCKNVTHLIITSCPECGVNSLRYFQSDLDFPAEILGLANAYVRIIQQIKDGLKGHIDEFDVSLPKRWSAKLECENGHQFNLEILLPQIS